VRSALLLLVLLAGCGCATCANRVLEMRIEVQRPLCVDEFATSIHDNCWVREC